MKSLTSTAKLSEQLEIKLFFFADPPRDRPWRALVVGVGGGPLPIYLNSLLGMHVTAVDLDHVVVELARRHFGLVESDTLKVSICLLRSNLSVFSLTRVCHTCDRKRDERFSIPHHRSIIFDTFTAGIGTRSCMRAAFPHTHTTRTHTHTGACVRCVGHGCKHKMKEYENFDSLHGVGMVWMDKVTSFCILFRFTSQLKNRRWGSSPWDIVILQWVKIL